MKHEMIFEAPNLLIMRLKGELTPEEVLRLNTSGSELAGGLTEIKFLADVSELGNMPPKSRETLIKNQMPFTYLKMALVAKKASIKVLGSLLFKMMPKVKQAKSFTSEAEARAWLADD
ncbi:STAS/SEC14 domain-containing protein [candidate division WOR-3 bacterium]|nr:STAS/SEC14 domain-containing protein [candidate division WOR-3 bacterium]